MKTPWFALAFVFGLVLLGLFFAVDILFAGLR